MGWGGQIKKAIFNDAQYEGTNWHPTEGVTTQDGAASGSRAAAILRGLGAQTTDIAVTGSHPAGTTVHGLNFETISVIDQGNRTAQIELRNRFLRYVSAFVQFSDEAGNLVDLGRDATQFDTTRAGFLTSLTSNYTILGIPLLGDDVLLGKFQFDVPPDASIAQVYLGSLGVGGEAFSPEAITGSILTLTFNLGLPTMLLILGAIPNKSLQDRIIIFLSTVAGKKIVVQLLEDVIGGTDPEIVGNGLFGTGNSRNGAVGALANIGNALLKALLSQKAAVAILEALGQNIAEDEALDSAGPLGLVFRLITLAANLSALAQSIGEVLSSPAIFTNTIRLTQTTTVTINHDPNDFRFPATARTWEMRLTYDRVSKVVHRHTGTIDPPGQRVDPIPVTFEGLPSGGTVSVDVYLTTESDCIVGRSMDVEGNVGPVSFPGNQKSIDITIKELPIPLTQTTQYEHVLKLEYDAETAARVGGDRCADGDAGGSVPGARRPAVQPDGDHDEPADGDGGVRI